MTANGEVCGRSWCTVKHDPNTTRQRMHCSGVWKSAAVSSLAVRVWPCPGRPSHGVGPSVAVDVLSSQRDLWARNRPRLPYGVGTWMDIDDVRALAYHLLDAAAWAEEHTSEVTV